MFWAITGLAKAGHKRTFLDSELYITAAHESVENDVVLDYPTIQISNMIPPFSLSVVEPVYILVEWDFSNKKITVFKWRKKADTPM